jgi:hypothetical protein
MNARPLAVVALLALAQSAVARAASGGPSAGDSEAAHLFQEAKQLMDEGRFAEACPKLDRSRALERQVGTTLNLALCYERLGKTATSWSTWLDGAAEAAAKGQVEREALARRRAAMLESRLLRITILVAPQQNVDAIDLQVDGVSIPKSRWGAPTPVDPGEHWVLATAEGRRPWRTTIEVDDQHVPLVQIGVLEKPAPSVPAAAPPAAAPRAPIAGGLTPRKTAALLLGGGGIVALAGMSALGLVARSTYLNASCIGAFCDKSGIDDRDRAATEAGLATAAGVTAASALVGAAVLWFSAPTGHATLSVRPAATARDWGLSVQGAW